MIDSEEACYDSEENITPQEDTVIDSKRSLVNKRIDFDQKTLKRIEMMVAAFRDELDSGASTNDVMSYVIAKAIDNLFEGEFKQKLNDM